MFYYSSLTYSSNAYHINQPSPLPFSVPDTHLYIKNICLDNIKKFPYFLGSNHVDIFLGLKLKKQ